MKLLNVYYGTDAYEYEQEPYHAVAKYRLSPMDFACHVEKAKADFANGKCHWYLITVTDIDPMTGASTTETTFDSRPPKEKVILNAAARNASAAKKKKLPPKAPNPNDLFQNFLDAIPMPAGVAAFGEGGIVEEDHLE